MGQDQTAPAAVSLRERVKSPPAQTMIDSYYAPAVAAGIRFQFEPEMRIHLAHALMLAERKIVDRPEMARILARCWHCARPGRRRSTIDYRQEDLYSYIERSSSSGSDRHGRPPAHGPQPQRSAHHLLAAGPASPTPRLLTTVLRCGDPARPGRDHVDTVMPGYTHTQHAQPISFGYYLLSAADLVERDFRRLASALSCCDRSPLGSGALSTTGFPIDREMTSRLLGFSGLVEVGYDGVAIRDDVHEAVRPWRS